MAHVDDTQGGGGRELGPIGRPPQPLKVVVKELVHSCAGVHVRVGQNRRSVTRRVAQHSILWMEGTEKNACVCEIYVH